MRIVTAAAGAALLAACGAEPSGAGAPDAGAGVQTATPPRTAAATPERRAFRDWTASCDNGAACFAFAGAAGGDTGWIRVALEAGAAATPQVDAGFWPAGDPSGGDAPDDAPLTLTIDGRSWRLEPADDAGSPHGAVPAAQAAEAARALAAARAVTLSNGVEEIALDPSGATAALLWIDERQGRLNTTTALVRRGPLPASSVPAAPALPLVRAAPAVDQAGFSPAGDPARGGEAELVLPPALAALPEVRRCRENLARNPDLFRSVGAWRLSARAELWAVPCDAGAYNIVTRLFATGPGGADPRPVALPIPEALREGPRDPEIDGPENQLINPAFDPTTGVLSHFPRGRGLGDCGVIQSWTWTGRDFVLSEARSMGQCRGMPHDLWPTDWRTRGD